MVTYKAFKPLKKIVIPIMSLIIGLGIAYTLMPTKVDVIWKEWNNKSTSWEQQSYALTSTYIKDGKMASEAKGLWADELSQLTLSAAVSDDTVFAFDIYIEDEKIFIHVGDEWRQGTTADRFINEITPLDHPFEWMRDLIAEAKTIEKYENGAKVTYVATFVEFDELDFRGYSLEKQTETTLTLIVENDISFSMEFHVLPIRPDYVGRFDGYPTEINYQMSFEKTNDQAAELPPEAYISKGLDE